MTVSKTPEDLRLPKESGPKIINAEASDEQVKALKSRWPNAREIEKLPSGTFAVRFAKKRAKYAKPWKHH